MAASSSFTKESVQQSSVKSDSFKLSRSGRYWIVLAMFTVASIIAFKQPLNPDPYRAATFPSLNWFLYPSEQNAHRRLHEIKCDLNAIYALDGTEKIWAVGNRGLVAHSDDGGRSWRKQMLTAANTGYAPTDASPTTSPSATQTPSTIRKSAMSSKSLFDFPDLLPVAHASELNYQDVYGGQPPPLRDPVKRKDPDPKQSNPTAKTVAAPVDDYAEKERLRLEDEKKKKTTGAQDPYQGATGATRGSGTDNRQTTTTPRAAKSPVASTNRPSSTINRNVAEQSSPTPPTQTSPSPSNFAAPEASSVDEDLIAVYFADAQRGSVLGRSGTIFSTNDGGSNWSRQPPNNVGTTPLRSAGFANNGFPPYEDQINWFVNQSGELMRVLPFSSPLGSEKMDLRNIAGVHFFGDGTFAWAVGDGGKIFNTTDAGSTWREQPSGTTQDLRAVNFLGSDIGWAVGEKGTMLRTTNGGQTWATQPSRTSSDLNSISFVRDGQRGYAAGYDGTILGTTDGGANWFHQTQESDLNAAQAASSGGRNPLRSLPPWYYVSWLLVGLLLWPVRHPPPPVAPPEESIADVLIADRPLNFGEYDPLNFTPIALGVSRFLRNDKTVPPLTIAVTGEWGTGKSSLMNMLRTDLMRYGFRPVWFNAWHHQKEEHLLASLLQNIKLQAIPEWWHPNGLKFRAKLLWIRGWRHRLPVLLLLLLLSTLIGYEINHPGGSANTVNDSSLFVQNIIQNISNGKIKTLLGSVDGSLLALLVNVVGVLIAAWKGMTAFKVNPASLMASMSRGVRIRDLAAQTSFRQNFAAEFGDVTAALGARSMLIFIDDLDRCRPENVLETLEAVNFLVASGDCFVVMGMARERIERCVGLSFKDVAEEMAPDQQPADSPTALPQPASPERAKQRRADFARQYLDKLINIEVPVPVPTHDQFGKLLVPDPAPPLGDAHRAQRMAAAAIDRVRQYWPVVMVLSVITLGYIIGAGVSSTSPIDPAHTVSSGATANSPTNTGAMSSATTSLSPSAESNAATPSTTRNDTRADSANPTVDAPVRKQIAEIMPPARVLTPWRDWLLVLGTFIAALALGAWAFTRRPDVITKDSKEFEDALRIWCPLVYARQKTPRSIKRFMNRVRYLAMRYRPSEAMPAPWEDFVLKIGALFGWKREPPPAEQQTRERIEPILVALSAIHHLNPTWIENENQWTAIANESLSVVGGSATDARTLVQQARDTHIRHFGRWGVTNQHREEFLRMLAGIRVN
ncbi:MAG: YCF48-related protein [Acidobacteriota bacterium]|nr:YCF48-related protein [Acidobacteriota bacterium]